MEIDFAPFRLDTDSGHLWRDGQRVALRPKTWAVLRYLVEHHGRLITKRELLEAVWPDVAVTEEVASGAVRELRRVLGDDPRAPRFIEIVHGRGFRFIAAPGAAELGDQGPGRGPAPSPEAGSPHGIFVGRDAEVQRLQNLWRKAVNGERQLVFITGEAGIGKTTLVEAFLSAAAVTDVWIGRGQAVEQHSVVEPFMPMLDVLRQLCGGPHGAHALAVLRQYASAWLLQLSGVLGAEERQAVVHEWAGVTPERLLRMLVDALETLSLERPLIVVLEDLHWTDLSTVDVLVRVAQRRDPARLLVLATYRPVEASLRELPLPMVKHDLLVHRRGVEIALDYLAPAALVQYVAARYPGVQLPEEMVAVLHRRTGGNPLFMVTALESWETQGALAAVDGQWHLAADVDRPDIPDSLRHIIERQLALLSPDEQRVLEAGSVVGFEFDAVLAAAALATTAAQVEAWCGGLTRRRHVIESVATHEWSDGTAGAGYRFVHPLYQEVLYAGVTGARRRLLHERIAERLATADAANLGTGAAAVAWHSERAGNADLAVRYYEEAAAGAVQRYAYQQIIESVTAALALIERLPAERARDEREVRLRFMLGPAWIVVKGHGRPEVQQTYEHALTLCRKWDDTFAQLVALGALCIVHLTRAALTTARALGEQLVELAERTGLPETFRSMAYVPLGQALCYSGELPAARAQLERARAFCAAAVPLQDVGGGLWVDAEVTILVHLSGTLCLLGYPEQAVRSAEQAIARARALQNPYSLHFALVLGGTTYQLQRNWTMLERCTTEALQIANECGFSFFGEHAEVLQAISRVERGPNALGAAADIDAIQAGVDRLVARGTRLALGNYLVALAAALGRSGRVAAALQTIDKALAHVAESGEAVMEAEIYCVKGELLLMEVRGVQGWPEPEPARRTRALGTAHHDAAEAHFQRAIEVARQQGAKWWELRAATSLSRLWQQHGKEGEARALLGATVGWFGEGFATPDLQEARSLLAELGVTDSGQ